ncbi:MAG: hypothetical protein QM770_08560 [Tepidisphaeraceae bacterium]
MEDFAPPSSGTGNGFERTTLRQFNVFLENRVGRLSLLLHALEDGGQEVNAISIEQSADAALVRLLCADPVVGRQCLLDAGFSFSESDVIAVMMPKEDHFPLIGICRALLAAEINVHYAYPMLKCSRGSTIVLYVDDRTLAGQVLIRKGYTIIGESDLKGPCIDE